MDYTPTYTLATRRRTPQQLQRKRMLDRAAQRVKRMKEKDRRLRVQDYLNCMQQTINSLGDMVQNMAQTLDYDTPPFPRPAASENYSSPPSSTHDISPGDLEDAQGSTDCPTSLSYQGSTRTAARLLPENKPPFRGQISASRDPDRSGNGTTGVTERDTQSSSNSRLCMSYLLSPTKSTGVPSDETSFVVTEGHSDEQNPAILNSSNSSSAKDSAAYPSECLCAPRKHVSYLECFEYLVYESLMEKHDRSLTLPDIPLIPLRPTLSDLLFLGEGENLVSAILNKILRVSKFPSLNELFGTYIHLYRLLRVSLLFMAYAQSTKIN